MEESHFRGLPFDRIMKSLSILVVCYKESKLAGLKHKKKKLNLCDHHIPEALESPLQDFHAITDITLRYR